MLGLELTTPVIARRRRGNSAPPPVFPATAFGYWEGQGQSNMTGFNQVADAPANLRIVNPAIEMMTDAPGWRPYILLDDGESQTVDGTLYEGKLDEIEIPAAAGGAGPLIGLHEAMIDGAMDGDAGLLPAGLLMGKFADAGKHLDEFLSDHDDGTPPLGGANFNARNNHLPSIMRSRLAGGEVVFAQGKIWFHGEANAAAARGLADLGAPDIVDYAAGFARIRAFDREQLGAPALPYYLCAIAAVDAYDDAINAALESECRWRVQSDASIQDLGSGRDATSYFIDHMIDTAGAQHFDLSQMRAIGALIWAAHVHHAGNPFGLTKLHPVTAITPVRQRPAEVVAAGHEQIDASSVLNEVGVLYGLIQPAGAAAPNHAAIVAGAQESAASQAGRQETLSFTGLDPETAYDVWLAFVAASGDTAAVAVASATTDQAPATAWTPDLAGALHWWDAQDAASVVEDTGEVAAWVDKSPTAATLVASGAGLRPVLNPAGLNGLPAVDFDGDDDLEAPGVTLAPDMCLLVVAEIDLPTNGSEALIDYQNQNLKVRANNSGEFRARFELQNGATTNINPSPAVNYGSAPHLFVGRYDSTADRIEVWIDGVEVGAKDTYTADLATTDNLRLMRPFGSALRLDGKVGEVVAIASALSADREKLEGYAAHRWGLEGLLPAGHPYKSAAP